jgi:hypothetical protein
MENKIIVLTLIACAISTFLFFVSRYVWNGGNFSSRLGYSFFMSIVPAVATFLLLKLMKPKSAMWQTAVGIYFILFVVMVFVQSYA